MQRGFLLGLIGQGIQASLTPEMHMREGAAHGFRCLYRLIDLAALQLSPEALPDLLTAAERMGFDGLNITHPCKQAVLPFLTDLSDDARAIGAVNTVIFRNGARIGHNTDASGFAASFGRGLPGAKLDRVVQFGAGGAGAAVAHAILRLGAGELLLIDTEPDRVAELAAALCARFGQGRAVATSADAVTKADGIINATPVGMAKYPGQVVPSDVLLPGQWVADVVYFPLETALIASARAKGCRILPGGGMAVFQAVEAFRLFTGAEPDADRMLASFRDLTASA